MFGLTFRDTAFVASLGHVSLSTGTIPSDDIESYPNGANLNGQNGGLNGTSPVIVWLTGYAGIFGVTTIQVQDTFETYTNGVPLSGLNGELMQAGSWNSAYLAIHGFTSLQEYDTFQSYTNGVALSGLNGGTNEAGTWNSVYAVF